MRLTVTVKGELEEYLQEQAFKSGISIPMTLVMLAMEGMQNKKSLNTLNVLAQKLHENDGVIKDK